MNGFLLLLLFCIGTICGAYNSLPPTAAGSKPMETNNINSTINGTTDESTRSPALNTAVFSKPHKTSRSAGPKPTSTASTTTTTTTTTSTGAAKKYDVVFFLKELPLTLIVTGILILVCIILLVSTLLLTWKVCQLRRRLQWLDSKPELISNTDHHMETSKKNGRKSDPEAKETSMLMDDFSQTQEDMGNGTAKEEGGMVKEDGQMGEENKKEVEGTANSKEASTGENKEETPVTVAGNLASFQLQEDSPNSQFTNTEAASSSEGTEEPNDVV